MKREKFDSVLSYAVLDYEQTSVHPFNRNKVWRKSTGNRYRKNVIISISVAATLFLVLNILWGRGRQEHPRMSNNENKAVNPAYVETQIQRQPSPVSRAEQKVSVFAEKAVDIIPDYRTKPSDITEVKPVIQQLISQDFGSSNNPPVASVIAGEMTSSSNTEEIKITFKRGRSAEAQPQPDMIISFRKGNNLKSGIKNMNGPDSVYYVNTNPFKLKFKQ
jgi:hypothetical protein